MDLILSYILPVWNWIKANLLLSIGIAVIVIGVLFWKSIKKIVAPRRRVRHRRVIHSVTRRRSLPRSVGMHKTGSSYRRRSTGRKGKKAWQIKGSIAARRRMARIRKMR